MFFNTFIQTSAHFIKHYINHLTSSANCLLCGTSTDKVHLCSACFHSLPILPHHCPQCAHFLPGNYKNEHLCGRCQKQTPPFERTFALFPYYSPIMSMITQLKFHHQLAYAALFGQLLTTSIRHHWYREEQLPDLILPVPLHTSRLRERGFNQAYEIARPIATSLGIPIDADGVIRCKITNSQRQLTASQRKLNIQGAFIANRPYTGKRIAIVDDVVTTGHTVGELCRLLKAHGAGHIDIWCAARQGQLEVRRLTGTPDKRYSSAPDIFSPRFNI